MLQSKPLELGNPGSVCSRVQKQFMTENVSHVLYKQQENDTLEESSKILKKKNSLQNYFSSNIFCIHIRKNWKKIEKINMKLILMLLWNVVQAIRNKL